MRDGYAEVPVTSRAAQAELERQLERRAAAAGGAAEAPRKIAAVEKRSEPEGPLDAPTPIEE